MKEIELQEVNEDELKKSISPFDLVLGILQKQKIPVSKSSLLEKIEEQGLSISENILEGIISEIKDRGYDIKTVHTNIEPLYSLVRFSKHNHDAYYRVLDEIETPFIISSDQHFGAKTFTEQGWNQLVKDAEEYSVHSIVMPGDIIQGRGVHSMEAMDCKMFTITDQMNECVKKVNMLPKDVVKHTCLGSHEFHIKGSVHVGLDVLSTMAPRIKNWKYYGSVAKLRVDNDYTLLFLHTSGGMPYAISYRAQKLWEGLIERPNLLVTGHLHQLFAIPRPRFNMLLMGGTLQRENAYLINKGIIAQIGWIIVEKFNKGKQQILFRIPEVY